MTVSRFLPNGEMESFRIEEPPKAFRIDWENKVAIPVEPRTAQGRLRTR
ncbi:MAG: hypothetical protein JO010_01055 [Alphaproteobacteria bacterium]|nr:hypothetical protein [Alphaproteobacteria bacterium]